MTTLEITIQRRLDGACPVVSELAAADGGLPTRNEGRLAIDPAALMAEGLDAQAYGQRLGAALFNDAIRDSLAAALAGVPRVRLLLAIEDPELAALRWERLSAPLDGAWHPLALSGRVLYSRYQPSLADRRFPPIGRRDLRALVIVAAPEQLSGYGLVPFDAAAALAGVVGALGPIACTTLASADGAAGPPTLDALCAQIVAASPTLLHLVCHGRVTDEGESLLYLARADDPRQVDPVPATRLIERLTSLEGARGLPHMVFLASCESASPAAAPALGSLAQRLVRDLGTPAVVAMADKVSVSTAAALAAAFYPKLAEQGHPDQALADAMATLRERADAIVPGIYGRLGGRPLFSDTLDRPLTAAEIRHGLERMHALVDARAPVLAAELDEAARRLRGGLGADLAALGPDLQREHEAALAQVGAICEEATELSFAALALGQSPPPYEAVCPFPGLAAFQANEGRFFFGREALVRRLAEQLAAHPFLAILGPSGSGKSSLARAGLIPALMARRPDLPVTTLTPGARPLERLQAALSVEVGQTPPGPRLVLVDQLEELFTLCADPGERLAFSEWLVRLAGEALVVVTMRADFWGEVASYPRLREAMQAHQELVGPLTPAELRAAIEQQAGAVGLRFESGLGGQILEDVAGEPGAMPLLQHALAELWRRRRGRWLRSAEYEAIGGVAQAIAHSADGIYLSLGEGERERLRDSLVRLTRLDPEAGDGPRRDTRRRVALAELVPAGGDHAATRELVRRLADARLLVTSVSASGAQEVEVAHEALIRAWPRLQGWLSEDRQGLRVREAVRQAALEWVEAGRDESRLVHRGGRLDEAAATAARPRFAPNAQERAYLDACLELRRREHEQEQAERQRELQAAQELAAAREQTVRRTQRLAGAVAVVALLAVAAAVIALLQTQSAQRSAAQALAAQQEAEERATEARAAALAAQAGREGQARPQLGALLAVEAMRVSVEKGQPVTIAAEQALREAVGRIGGLAITQISAFTVGGIEDNPLEVLSPDGSRALTARSDGAAWLWDVEDPAKPPLTLRGQRGPLSSARFSPDGRWLATVTEDELRLWDLTAPSPAATRVEPLSGEGGFRQSHLAFSPASSVLAVGGVDGLYLFDLARPTAARMYRATAGRIIDVAFSPDGTSLASVAPSDDSGSGEDTVTIWTAASLEPQVSLPANLGHGLSFSPDGRRLALAAGINTIYLWDLERPERADELTLPCRVDTPALFVRGGQGLLAGCTYVPLGADGPGEPKILISLPGGESTEAPGIVSFATGPDGMVAAGASDGSIVLLTFEDDSEAPVYGPVLLYGHESLSWSLAFSADGTDLISLDDEGRARRWHVAHGAPSIEPEQFPAFANSALTGSPLRLTAVDHSGDGTVVYDLGASPPTRTRYNLRAALGPEELLGDPMGAAVSTDQRRLLTLGRNADDTYLADVWDLAPDGTARHRMRLAAASDGAVLSPDGRWLLINPGAGWAILDLEAADPLASATPFEHSDEFAGPATIFSPDGRRMIIRLGQMTLWRIDGAAPVREAVPLGGDSGMATTAAFSADGSRLAVGLSDGTLEVWDLDQQPVISPTFSWRLWEGSENMTPSFAISPDGQRLAISGGDAADRVFELAAGPDSALSLPGHTYPAHTLAFSPDGRSLATASYNEVLIWDFRGAAPVGPFPLAVVGVADLAFGQDGRLLTDTGMALRVWRHNPETLRQLACAAAGRNMSPQDWARFFSAQPQRPTCPDQPAHPDQLARVIAAAERSAQAGDIATARSAMAEAQELSPGLPIPGSLWATLCLGGALNGRARDVLDACGQAVLLDGADPDARDARALARALTGDPAGAADDLRASAAVHRSTLASEQAAEQREAWAAALEAGRSPFSKEWLAAHRAAQMPSLD